MSKLFTPQHVTERFGLELSERYQRFLTNKEWKKLDRRFAIVPSYAAPLRVGFQGKELESFFRDDDDETIHTAATEADLGRSGWVPLATLGKEEPTFLAVRASEAECRVGLWEPETRGFKPCADSLDAFLEGLGATAKTAKEPITRGANLTGLRDAVNRTAAALEGPRSKAQLARIEAALATLVSLMTPENVGSQKALQGGEHDRLPSTAYLTKAKALAALGRFEEACVTLDDAVIDGERASIAPEMLCRLLLEELDRPDRVIEICEPVEATLKPIVRGLFALALLRRGDIDRAEKQYETLIERQVEAAVALSPKIDRGVERKKRLAKVRASVEEYAKRHRVGAQARELLTRIEHRGNARET